MIAFITISSLVPLIEGLCRSDSISIRVRFFHVHIFGIAFAEPKICERKKDLIPPPSIYTHMCTLYTYTNAYMLRFSQSGFFGPSRCLVLTPGLSLSTPRAVCVCACVFTHTHTHTLPAASKIEKTQDKHPRQATSALHRLAETPHPHPPTLMNKLRIHERMCTTYSDCVADMYADVKTPV